MGDRQQWLFDLPKSGSTGVVDGIVPVEGFRSLGKPPEVVAIMEKAKDYSATAVFFEAGRDGRPPVAQAFIFRSDGPAQDQSFAGLHRRLWSWGGVPLVYRETPGLVQLFRCAHKADFERNGKIVFKPFRTLKLTLEIAADPWWDAERLRNGTLWDDPKVCKSLLSGSQAAQKTLINEVRLLHEDLNKKAILPAPLRRKLLILSLLIAYLEARKVFEADYFGRFREGATKFFEVLADAPALVALLERLEVRFNGDVFGLAEEERRALLGSRRLRQFSRLIEARREAEGQLTLWERYSFADLPVELISHIYQLFVKDTRTAVYTPPFLVRLMLGEVLSWDRLDRLEQENSIILDPACGSGVFLVEAYKRLVLHWRSRNQWGRPEIATLQRLLRRVHGIDLEEGAVELAAFSLCLALCDALKPEEIRASVKLFPPLKDTTIHHGCFFKACEQRTVKDKIGVVVGNPPFSSTLSTPGAERAYAHYQEEHGALPDKQLAYLFLHMSMEMIAEGGTLSMLQQYNFLYNQKSEPFRRRFMERWDVREILDLISVRGLFHEGGADTKVVVVVAEAAAPPPERQILHATFRRSGRADANQGFDIDYYDLHWLPRELVLANDAVWRSDLLGGGRVLDFVDRMKKFPTLGKYAEEKGWDYGEGWIEGKTGKRLPAEHITNKRCLPSECLTVDGVDESGIETVKATLFKTSYTARRFTPPMVLIREQMDLPHTLWSKGYLTYRQQIVGVCAPEKDIKALSDVCGWLDHFKKPLQAYLAAASPRLFAQKSTALTANDAFSLPYCAEGGSDLSAHEQVLVDDIVDYYRDLIRLGEGSPAMKQSADAALPEFNDVYTQHINAIYKNSVLRALDPERFPGMICQPFAFGEGTVDWEGSEELKGRLDTLLDQRGSGLTITRIARIYDGPCIYLLKPDRLRYWLRSVALRDADETLADLWEQGF